MKIAVISDTHIPDRAAELHPALIEVLQHSQPELILHAGDISVPAVLHALEAVAPVKAVRGNRDFLLVSQLPITEAFEVEGTRMVLTHGHLSFLSYAMDKFHHLTRGYDRNRIIKRLAASFPQAKVIVFGHTHRAENVWVGGQLFFNPGSATMGDLWVKSCSYGELEINPNGEISSRIVPLQGFQLIRRKWERKEKS